VAAPPGNHTILAEADAEYSAGELNATHAETNTTVYVWPALPDLEALSISIYPYPASEGVQTRVNATIRNHGVIEAQDVNVVLIDNEGVVAGAVITIPADPTGSTRMNITFNYTSVAGVHLLTIFLDPKNNIPEYNETDNSVSLRIEVPEKPGGINLAAISLIAIILLMLFIITYIWREKILSLMIAMIIWVLILVINIPLLRRMVDEVYRGMKGGGYPAAQMIVKKGQ
jgi:subtilase family serine protease